MPVIRIDNFGGEMPRASARTLPPTHARVSYNMYHGGNEFRPNNADTVVASVAAGTKTLHRLERLNTGVLDTDMTQRWIVKSGVVHYAKGQVNDDKTSRTYYSVAGGGEPPRVFDASGSVDKLLGIPAPTPPLVQVIVGEEYTPEEFEQLMKMKVTEVSNTIRANSAVGYVTDRLVTESTVGYLNRRVSGELIVPAGSTGTTTVLAGGGGFAGVQSGVTVVGGGTFTYTRPEDRPTINLPAGSTVFERSNSLLYTKWLDIKVGADFTTPGGDFVAQGNTFRADFGQRYSIAGPNTAIVAIGGATTVTNINPVTGNTTVITTTAATGASTSVTTNTATGVSAAPEATDLPAGSYGIQARGSLAIVVGGHFILPNATRVDQGESFLAATGAVYTVAGGPLTTITYEPGDYGR